jgi:catechol 2,3-dioxygenase-like lactoylglutathione lyase family enzyme
MQVQAVHHVAIASRDLKRSLTFYNGVLCLTPAPRPDFPVGGARLDTGTAICSIGRVSGLAPRRTASIQAAIFGSEARGSTQRLQRAKQSITTKWNGQIA